MRVIMVTPSYYPIKGGAESTIRSLAVGLNKNGIQTDIMTFNMDHKWKPYWQAKKEIINGIDVFKIPAVNWFPMEHSNRITLGINLIPGRFRNHLNDYDIVHFHGEDLTFPVFSCGIGKPKIFHSHGFSFDFYRRYFLSRSILKNIADLYISISETMKRELAELGIPPNKIRYLPNGVDTQVFHPAGEKDGNLILFVGRITFDKGLRVLMQSLRLIKKKIRLVIIGPPDWDVQFYREMEEQIAREKTRGRHQIAFLGGQEEKSIIEWYQRASVFVLPSFREASPVTILEALSCETPVVATNVGAIPEMIHDGKNGFLVPPNNPVKLAESIEHLLDDEDLRIRLGQNGRKDVIRKFSYDVTIGRLVSFYKEILREKSGDA